MGSSPRVWGQELHATLSAHQCRIIPTRMGTSKQCISNLFTVQDHPHAYGDKITNTSASRTRLGSSPRVWGQVLPRRARAEALRIIPTRMGTSKSEKLDITVNTDHPHAYGDKKNKSPSHEGLVGSSPRVWGQVLFSFEVLPLFRIIPTRMGTR